ncbi:MAG: imidazole glycerol phosphate synthase subunit HisH [Clostridia bacterium]|nr:imidazole glycerol phosphate synthase subunit HisH [Clostridia bacterium]
MIGIVGYGAGNSASVKNALNKLGVECLISKGPEDLENVDAIILPGVGSADATMEALETMGYRPLLERRVRGEGIPFLGICVGLQILFSHSEEGDCDCLGWFKGQVRRFGGDLRVPQIGWNAVNFTSDCALTAGVPDGTCFYFVNSYRVIPEEEGITAGITEYGGDFCSMICRDNIFAAQFHIEKSGEPGLRMLANFAALAKK